MTALEYPVHASRNRGALRIESRLAEQVVSVGKFICVSGNDSLDNNSYTYLLPSTGVEGHHHLVK